MRRHRTARVFPTRRAFSVRPPHSARWDAPNCAFLPYLFTSSAPFFSFLLLFSSPFRYEEANIGKFRRKVPRYSSKIPPFSRIFSRVLPRASPGTPALCHSLHFSSPSAVDNRSETHKFHLLMHHILRRRCAFPLPLSQSSVISHHYAPLASSSRLLRFQNSPSTRPIPPHTSIFSDRFIHNYPLPLVINPTFPHLSETHLRDMTQKLTIRTIIRCLSSHFAIQILPLSCKIRRTLQKCEEKAWRIGIKALALPKDDRKLGCLNVNNVQSAVRNRQNRLSPDPQA